ncbi:MAG: cryptochrome/photolyase family protein [Verrucomicrobiaceae bacterium]
MSTVIHWFRRDLRLSDNTALYHATKAAIVVPVYVLSSWKSTHGWTGPKRQQFLCGNLESLAKNLEAIGSKLILRVGDAVAELEQLARETRAEAVYFNRDPDPFGKAVEKKLHIMCQKLGIKCEGYKDTVMHEAPEVLTGAGQPYRVYTPYSKNWLGLPKSPPLPRVTSLGPAASVMSLPLPTLGHWDLTPPADAQVLPSGERSARDRMKHFIESGILGRYGEDRNLPAGQHGSCLSQDLRFGLISIRELYQRCQAYAAAHPAAAGSVLTYVKELAWREFYMAILHFYPEVLEHEFNPDWRELEWPSKNDAFQAWAEARTGFPIIDAGMRQLLTTGLMHNRVRMIVAMFLTKDLHSDWRLGEQFFHQHLIDAEIASNNGGWQWSAGTGADAAPYFRIQNPWTQTLRFDPEGAFIKQWLPELKNVPAARLCEAPKDGCPLVPGYPLPIVDHSAERDRCLAIFARHKERHAK